MSKKKFTTNLEEVFDKSSLHEPNIDDSPLLVKTSAPSKRREGSRTRRSSRKSFASDLDSLFAAEAKSRDAEKPVAKSSGRPRREIRTFQGLDSLIRDTTNGLESSKRRAAPLHNDEASPRKRLTFTYERDRIAKLKRIARQEGAYLKDIISGLLNEYIDNYEQQQGEVEVR